MFDGVEIIDLFDQFVLFGLIDSYVYLQGELSFSGCFDMVMLFSVDNVFDVVCYVCIILMVGFIFVQEVGGQFEVLIVLCNVICDGDVIGLCLCVFGFVVILIGGYGDINGYFIEVMDLLFSCVVCNGLVDCCCVVCELVCVGVDVIKIIVIGGVLFNMVAGVEQ